jgi:hypothetical protein
VPTIWWNIVSSSKERIEQAKEDGRCRPEMRKSLFRCRGKGAGPATERRAMVQRSGAGVRPITRVGHARF